VNGTISNPEEIESRVDTASRFIEVNMNALRGGGPVLGPRHRDVIAHYRTLEL
jgi:hypothetical protein